MAMRKQSRYHHPVGGDVLGAPKRTIMYRKIGEIFYKTRFCVLFYKAKFHSFRGTEDVAPYRVKDFSFVRERTYRTDNPQFVRISFQNSVI